MGCMYKLDRHIFPQGGPDYSDFAFRDLEAVAAKYHEPLRLLEMGFGRIRGWITQTYFSFGKFENRPATCLILIILLVRPK